MLGRRPLARPSADLLLPACCFGFSGIAVVNYKVPICETREDVHANCK